MLGSRVIVATKTRRDDRHVSVSLPIPSTETKNDLTPVLVDDIISSGQTMAECVARLRQLNFPPPICVAVHGVFDKGARQLILDAGAASIHTTNSISQDAGNIDISDLVAQAIAGI
jgi:ribose-phosphate pyrophosphokinase